MSDRKLFVVGNYCFIRHPCGAKSHWMRTDRCIAFVRCGYCKVPRGEACIGNSGEPTVMTHGVRRKAYMQLMKKRECGVRTMTIVIEEP